MRSRICKLLGHKVQKGWMVERIRGSVFTYERWTHICGRCKRVLDVEWNAVAEEQNA